jgi:hypothetical protein
VITRVAGTRTAGNSLDDGPATDAELNQPSGVAGIAAGGFLIADTSNNEVRAVSRLPRFDAGRRFRGNAWRNCVAQLRGNVLVIGSGVSRSALASPSG